MTKKEKETLNITLWKLARRYVRNENNGKNEEYLDGYYSAMVTVFSTLNVGIDLTDLLVKIEKGMTYDEIFNK